MKVLEIHAAKKSYAKNLLKAAAEALSLGRRWINETPHNEEVALLRESKDFLGDSRSKRAVSMIGQN